MTPYDTGRSTDVDPSRVQTHADFVAVCEAMFDDYEKSGKDEWENHTLGRFLDGLAALAEGLPQFLRQRRRGHAGAADVATVRGVADWYDGIRVAAAMCSSHR